MLKPEAESFVFHVIELGGCVEAGDREMVFGRPQVLAYGQDIDFTLAQVAEDFDQFFQRTLPGRP